jgi:hypothetical protein
MNPLISGSIPLKTRRGTLGQGRAIPPYGSAIGFLGVLMVAGAPLARADFQVLVNGVPCTPTVGTNPLTSGNPNGSLTCQNITVAPGVTIQELAVTGQQGLIPGTSEQQGTSLLVQNTTGSAVTITIDIGVSNFSSPFTPPNVSDSSGSTLNATLGTNSSTKLR